jgi:hypothetical protein
MPSHLLGAPPPPHDLASLRERVQARRARNMKAEPSEAELVQAEHGRRRARRLLHTTESFNRVLTVPEPRRLPVRCQQRRRSSRPRRHVARATSSCDPGASGEPEPAHDRLATYAGAWR